MKDTNGLIVGPILQEFDHGSVEVYREIAGHKWRFNVRGDGFVGTGPPFAINFDAPDCTGNAFVEVASVTVDPTALIEQAWDNGNALYYRDGVPAFFGQRSQMYLAVSSVAACAGGISQVFIPPAACCRTFAVTSPLNGYPVTTFDLGTLGLVPPFHVEGP